MGEGHLGHKAWELDLTISVIRDFEDVKDQPFRIFELLLAPFQRQLDSDYLVWLLGISLPWGAQRQMSCHFKT